MDATTLGGALLALVGTLAGAVVAYLGKRGETALSGYSHLTGDLQEERDRLERRVRDLETRAADQAAHAAEVAAHRAADQAELARLRAIIVSLGGTP
ncbi:hypothetical protein [Streptomyces tremellae]|uniref:Secreted protein n=1 Tax=Streptomyces tremellae TaxID=1124239 RepID=A0ABP7EZC6_9ACTN